MRKIRKYLLRSFLVLIVVVLSILIFGYVLLRSSLPEFEGEAMAEALGKPVVITFDEWAIPTIQAETRSDVAYALGYLHGSERFFQMDMMRRYTAGELSELLGKATLDMDKNVRIFQYRKRAQESWKQLPKAQQEQLTAYASGVNDGLNALGTRPFEYWLLFQKPSAWKAEDCLLLAYAYYNDMQGKDARLDKTLLTLYEQFPKPLADFFAKQANPWEAAMDGSESSAVPMPELEIWESCFGDRSDSESSNGITTALSNQQDHEPMGSNQWAVAGGDTAGGEALVANDPHLQTNVPGIWYRANYRYTEDGTGESIEANGFTLPGIPTVVIGQSRWTAWGFTVSDIDSQDLIEVIQPEGDSASYLSGEQLAPIVIEVETIRVRGGNAVDLEIRHTEWGPIVWTDPRGRDWAMHWTALKPNGVNLELFKLEKCRNLEEVFDTVNSCRLPVMNCVAGDLSGAVGWTLFGSVPNRTTLEPVVHYRSDRPHDIWKGLLSPNEIPRVVKRERGFVWTANNRVLGDEPYQRMGTGTHAIGSRAYQIREFLASLGNATAGDMIALQHDIEVPFFKRWKGIMLSLIEESREPAKYAELVEIVDSWDGRASVDSEAYYLISVFRRLMVYHFFSLIFYDFYDLNPEFDPWVLPYDSSIFQLVQQPPESLVSKAYENWRQSFDDAFGALAESFGKERLEKKRWGEINRLRVRHPLARVAPVLGRFLNMEETPMEGDSYCPKVINGSHIASMRMISVPGKPELSLFQMPTGQSGHPLSSHYDDLHELWLEKSYLPMQSGSVSKILKLLPAGST